MPGTPLTFRLKHFWQERVLGLLRRQLRQGVTPQRLALTVSLGICLSAFPILGTTSLLCLIAGLCLGLNQPVIQLINWLASPLQLALFAGFVRLGEKLTRAPRLSFSIREMFAQFHASPAGFFREFGLTAVHSILGWAVVAPVAGLLLYFILLPLAQKMACAQKSAEPSSC